ncbi:MAG: hypothetical protein TRG1_539 [Flavobacteriaceae bacterium FS1-H7996/R]|nr:MAG: hypothetical protein TRG1_539 [Flavobacteriaceae bacterium FS1-H7996/R]
MLVIWQETFFLCKKLCVCERGFYKGHEHSKLEQANKIITFGLAKTSNFLRIQ